MANVCHPESIDCLKAGYGKETTGNTNTYQNADVKVEIKSR